MRAANRWSVVAAIFLALATVGEAAPRGGRRVAPGSFQLSSPANGALNQSLTPTLSWTASSRASSYTISIGSLAPVSTAATSYVVPAGKLSAGTSYSWNVTAVNAYGSISSSNGAFTFTTAASLVDTTPPGVSAGHSPSAPNSTQAVTYTVNASDASGIAELRLFVDGILRRQVFGVTSTSYTEGPYAQGSSHSYYAVAIDNSTNRNSAASATGSFTVSAPSAGPMTTQQLTSVAYVNSNTIVAVGFSGTIVRSDNGGSTWALQASGTTNNLYSNCATDALTGTAVGGDPLFGGGRVLRTINGGASWTQQASGTGALLLGVSFVNASSGVVSANNGVIRWTNNGGATWNAGASGVTDHLYEVDMIDASVGFASGSRGVVLRTADGGMNWTKQITNTPYSLYGVSFVNASVGTVCGDGGVILRTTNGGATWVRQNSGTPYSLAGVSFLDASRGVAVGYGGMIFMTSNGGATWERRN